MGVCLMCNTKKSCPNIEGVMDILRKHILLEIFHDALNAKTREGVILHQNPPNPPVIFENEKDMIVALTLFRGRPVYTVPSYETPDGQYPKIDGCANFVQYFMRGTFGHGPILQNGIPLVNQLIYSLLPTYNTEAAREASVAEGGSTGNYMDRRDVSRGKTFHNFRSFFSSHIVFSISKGSGGARITASDLGNTNTADGDELERLRANMDVLSLNKGEQPDNSGE